MNSNLSESVDQWFAETSNPLATVMRAVADVILEDDEVTSTIKYRAPAFEYDGIICYFNWSAKKRVSLIFPAGQQIPGDHPELVDGSNLQRMMYFADLGEVASKAEDLRSVVAAAIAGRD